jgi:hypothetical protein
MRTTFIGVLSIAITSLVPRAAFAQGNTDRETAAKAEALFRNAKDADARGDLTMACAGFAESQRLDPAVGTLLNLADCEARSGRADDARAHYEDARSQMTPGDARRQFATDQISLLSSKATGGVGVEPPRDSVSAPPARDNGFSVAAMIGYGTDDMSVGLGLRAGKVVFSHVYMGAAFVYQFGDSTSSGVTTTTGYAGYGGSVSVSSSVSAYYVGPEVGYELEFHAGGSTIVFRPYVGLGLDGYIVSESATGAGVSSGSSSSTKTGVAFWPGVTGIYGFPGSAFFAMADVRAVTVPGGPAFGMFAGGGMRF